MRFGNENRGSQWKKRPAFIDEALSVLKSCLIGRPDLVDVLDALWNIDGVYGSSVKGASYAFRCAWFIEDTQCRRAELAHALSRIVARVCRNDAFILVSDQNIIRFARDEEELDLEKMRWLYRYQPSMEIADLEASFSEPLPQSASRASPARTDAHGLSAEEHGC